MIVHAVNYGFNNFYCPGRRLFNEHRCVTPLYVIPMWIFDCVID